MNIHDQYKELEHQLTRYRLRAIGGEELVEKFDHNTANPEVKTDRHTLNGSFVWSCTPEGHHFWSNLDNQMRERLYGK